MVCRYANGNMPNLQKVRDSMREILYKAKRIDNDEWVQGYLFDDKELLENK